ncbi:PepSY-associated TM helix domain-containing protein [Methylobacterium organophilum]|uniref:PepSY domain-containing protein n=1 Tax=Methylobacterium organophilum TaxID=410 RepID=A0ABQ4TDV0_METOR|nr:PepSY-associated TM helix domain-containing protein [Methylobacterium organophilum]GJE29246.1 hypothetical protein LKMONMHP_4125 [Methylobacterium organophilum]
MRNGLRQSMAWLHSWAGFVVGWVFFCVFVTGTASYYRAEISDWMRPEARDQAVPASPAELARAAETGFAHLKEKAPAAIAWYVNFPKPEDPVLDLYWMTAPDAPFGHARIDPATGGEPKVRETLGGDFLYRFHYELHMPPLLGRYLVGLCALVMLVALLSGIVTHRRIFADFFTFRRGKSAQRGWLDAHNVTGVLALPYHLLVIYTGLVTLAPIYMPFGLMAAYKGDELRFYAEAGQMAAQRPYANRPGTLAPVAPMVERAAGMTRQPLEMLIVSAPADASATVSAVFEEPHGLAHQHPQVVFDGASGAVIETLFAEAKPAVKTYAVMVGLHEAHFAGPALRVLFFLCGLMGVATVATGLVLWCVARAPRPGERPFFGLRLVGALNLGVIAGLPIGIAAYLLANRLLPLDLSGRGDGEVRAFFAAWCLAAGLGLLMPQRAAWRALFAAGAALFAALPVVDLLTLGVSGSPSLGFDAALLGVGALLAFASRKVVAARATTPRPRPTPAAGLAQLERA